VLHLPTLGGPKRPHNISDEDASETTVKNQNFPSPLHTGVPDQTLSDLDYHRILETLCSYARTEMGSSLCRSPRIYARKSQVQYQIDLTAEMRTLIDSGDTLPLGGIKDVRALLSHAAKQGTLEPEDLLSVADTLRGFWAVARFLGGAAEAYPKTASIAEELPELEILYELVFDAFDDHGELRDDASADLLELRGKRRSLHTKIRKRIAAMVHEEDVTDRLQDDYYTIREDRYVLPVRSGERSEVPGIIHGNSQTGRTLYIEPQELVPLNNELKLCERAVTVEERRILSELTRDVSAHADAIVLGLEIIARLDLVSSRALLSQAMKAEKPDVTTDTLDLRGARNPLLVLRNIKVVPNDIRLTNAAQFLVITGPNAGGKTVTLSTLGLCALMARAGMHLPTAPGSKIPIFSQVLCVLGDQQDLQKDLSTFTGHLARLHEVTKKAGPGTLVLLDEVAAGTQANQGAALAIAVLEDLANKGATGATTTHYDRLKTLGLEDGRFLNASVTLDVATEEPTYRLTLGTPGSSSALQMARRTGFPESIISRAEEILGDKTHSIEKILLSLESERESAQKERDLLAAERRSVEKESEHYRKARARLEERGEAIIREERESVFRDLRDARGALRRIVRELQRDKSPRAVNRRQAQLAELETRLQEGKDTSVVAAIPTALTPSDVTIGLEVFIPSFDKHGIIEAIKGNRLQVAIGSLRTTLKLEDLQPSNRKPEEPKKVHEITILGTQEVPVRTSQNTCDVRGMRVDEAVLEVEKFLDRLLLKNRHAGYVLHGYGTGRLKTGLHDAFRQSPYVQRYESATQDRGGDAVTLVWLH
jgi:DNA mismatch repair protein MutS2